jgi:hypothetical protein
VPATRLIKYLNDLPGLKGLRTEIQRLEKAQRALNRALPAELTASSRVCRLAHLTLDVVAESGAVAAKLRQLTPRLLMALKKQGVEVTTIRITAQAGRPTAIKAHREARAVSPEAARSLEELAGSLPPSPLKTALRRLARRGG